MNIAARKPLGILLIVHTAVLFACTALLGATVGFPGITDSAPGDALRTIASAGSLVPTLFYLYAVGGLLLAIIAVTVPATLAPAAAALRPSTVAGILAGVLATIGTLRWVLVAPPLAAQYLHGSGPAAREAARTGWIVVNESLGALAQDMLGFALAGVWLLLVARSLAKAAGAPRWWGALGQVLSIFGAFEFLTFVLQGRAASMVDSAFAATFAISLVWLGITGALITRSGRVLPAVGHPSPAAHGGLR